MKKQLFSTDLKRLTEILAINLYSDPFVPIRELLQNANDACLMREGFSSFTESRIQIIVNKEDNYIEINDNGCGMTEDELCNVLSRIASSNKLEKRQQLLNMGFDAARSIAGKFGLGILSCFIISCRLEIRTRSMEPDSPSLYWHSIGDGNYLWECSKVDFPTGTNVRLFIREDHRYSTPLFNRYRLKSIVEKYCMFLKIPIYLDEASTPINNAVEPWSPIATNDDINNYLSKQYNFKSLYHFRIDFSGTLKHTEGPFNNKLTNDVFMQALVVIPDTSNISHIVNKSHIYAAGIFIGQIDKVLPNWFNFGLVILSSSSLDLTLGRDNIVEDQWLAAIKQIIKEKLSSHLFTEMKNKASSLRNILDAIFKIHGARIKQDAVTNFNNDDGQFFEVIREIIPFTYNNNFVSIPEFCVTTTHQGNIDGKRILYYDTTGQGERGNGVQEKLIFDSSSIPYFSARNYYDRNFLEIYSKTSPEIVMISLSRGLKNLLRPASEPELAHLIKESYKKLGISAEACSFSPLDLTALIKAKHEPSTNRIRFSGNILDPKFDLSTSSGRQNLLESMAREEIDYKMNLDYTLCINIANKLVLELFTIIKREGFHPAYRMSLRLIYNSAVILFGEHSNQEMYRVITSGNILIRSFLNMLKDKNHEKNYYQKLLNRSNSDAIPHKAEAQVRTATINEEKPTMNSEEEKKTIFKQIYLSWNGDEAKEEFINGIKRLLKSKGYKITDSNDRLTEPDVNGSKIINNIKECSLVVGIFFDEKTYTRRISHQNLEEKGIALAAGKRIFYFKEEGIEDITLGTFLEHITIVPFTWETLVSRLFDLLDHLPPA